MKKIFFLLSTMSLLSCSSDEETSITNNEEVYPTKLCILDASQIETRFGYAMDEADLWLFQNAPYYFDKETREQHRAYYDSITQGMEHQPMNYDNLRILFYTRTSTDPSSDLKDENEKNGVNDYLQFAGEASSRILLSQKQMEEMQSLWAKEGKLWMNLDPQFFTARFTGPAIVKADKTLFGREAGRDLSDHFRVEGPGLCLPQGTLRDFGFLFWYDTENRPSSVHEFFSQDTWLQRCYAFRLCDMPEETYPELTFTIELPTVFDYWYDYYRYGREEMRTERRTLSATCTVHLGITSDFEQKYEKYRAENDQLEWH